MFPSPSPSLYALYQDPLSPFRLAPPARPAATRAPTSPLPRRARAATAASQRFFRPAITPQEIKFRSPPTSPADPLTVVDSSYSCLRILAGGIQSRPPTLGPALRVFSFDIHRTDFAPLMMNCRTLLHRPTCVPFVPLLAYIGGILNNEFDGEMAFSCAVSNADFRTADFAHCAHLLDELCVLGSEERTPLLRLLVGAAALQCPHFVSPTRLVPPLGAFFRLNDAQMGRQTYDHIAHAQFLGGRHVPDLVPVPEGFERVPVDGHADLPRLIEGGGRLREALSLASAMIETLPGNRDAVFYGLMAFTRAGKITDAIAECARLADVWPQDVASIERALWRLLGQEQPAPERDVPPLSLS